MGTHLRLTALGSPARSKIDLATTQERTDDDRNRDRRRAIASGAYVAPDQPKAIASAQRIAELIRQANPEGIDQ